MRRTRLRDAVSEEGDVAAECCDARWDNASHAEPGDDDSDIQ
jgi:hypothetical protein